MIPCWPSELRQRTLVAGFKSGTRGARLVTAMEEGPPKQRPRGNKVRPISFTDEFSANQRARFDRFWEEELNMGTLPFFYPDPHTNGFPLCDDLGSPLLDQDGTPVIIGAWILCTFSTAEPAWSALGGGWFVPQFDIIELP